MIPSQNDGNHDDVLLKIEELKSNLEGKIQALESSVKTAIDNKIVPSEQNMKNAVESSLQTATFVSLSQIKTTIGEYFGPTEDKVAEVAKTSIRSTLDECFGTAAQKLAETVEASVNQNMARAWNSTIFGEEDFPAIGSNEWTEVTSNSKKTQKTLPQLIEQSVTQSVTEVTRIQSVNEQRRNNVIIYRAPEPTDEEANDRLESDEKLVHDLFKEINVRVGSAKVYRLGKFDENKKDRSRPITVELENPEKQAEIMVQAKTLKDAPDHQPVIRPLPGTTS